MESQTRTVASENPTNNRQRDTGASSAGHEQRATSNFVNEEESWEGAQAVDDAVDAGSEEGGGVAVEAELGEDGWCVVDHS